MKKIHLLAAAAVLSTFALAGAASAKSNDTLPYYMKSGAQQPVQTEQAAPEAPAPMTGMGKCPMVGGAGPMMMGRSKISDASEQVLRGSMQKMHQENKVLMDAIMAKHEEMQAIVKAPVFDKAAYLTKHEEMQALHHKMGAAHAQAMADALENIPAADRAQMGAGRGMMMHAKHHMMGKSGPHKGHPAPGSVEKK